MKKKYEKPMLNTSMEGTLEGVYAYGLVGATGCNLESACTNSSNKWNDNPSSGEDNYCGAIGFYVSIMVVDVWCGFIPVKWHYEERFIKIW